MLLGCHRFGRIDFARVTQPGGSGSCASSIAVKHQAVATRREVVGDNTTKSPAVASRLLASIKHQVDDAVGFNLGTKRGVLSRGDDTNSRHSLFNPGIYVNFQGLVVSLSKVNQIFYFVNT